MTSSHRQLLLLETWWLWQKKQQCLAIGNWVHQMFVVFLSGLVLFSAVPLLALFVFCFKLDKCLRMNNIIGQNSKGCNLRCMECYSLQSRSLIG
jgi:hypothetical protein